MILRNSSSTEAAVRMTIDGISVFEFSKLTPKREYFLLPGKTADGPGEAPVNGWVIDEQTSAKFLAVEYPDSAASQLKIEPNTEIGQICVQFSQVMPVGQGSRAVAVGEKFEDRKTTELRSIGNLQATIQVRYEK